MNFTIKHELQGRIRISLSAESLSYKEADTFSYYLSSLPMVEKNKVFERTADAIIFFKGDRESLIEAILDFDCRDARFQDLDFEHSGRELAALYREKLVFQLLSYYGRKLFLPAPLSMAYTGVKALKYIWEALKCLGKRRLEVPVLDGVAIGVSLIRGDFDTAGSVMFLLGIGETLEEWTHKKSVNDLAQSMSLHVDKIWIKTEEGEVFLPIINVKENDEMIVRMGDLIPLDGRVISGEAMLNQASLTGESQPVKKEAGAYVYAGTVVEEGELLVQVKKVSGSTRFEKIVSMIEDSERLKSSLEGKAEHIADSLVPYTFAGTLITYFFTRNVSRALSVLMVDFSCALKLAMPLAVLSAMREAGERDITVKGGKFLEAVAEADTIVFDKTGTLTKAEPQVKEIIAFGEHREDEVLKIAACLEEHFPHSMANAVVEEARRRNLSHEEMHSKVEYVVAHGISSNIDGKKTVIGSAHFVFEDEGCKIPAGEEEKFHALKEEYSHLFLAIQNELSAVICIEDPLREEAAQVIAALRGEGFKNLVMMTGDSERTAKAIARRVGVDSYFSEVLPEDKAAFIEKEKAMGRKVVMIGDGINDTPALSAADAGIAISQGAQLAREIADITISSENLFSLLILRRISRELTGRIKRNYRMVIGINTGLILLGVTGLIMPTTSALMHNISTLAISMNSMKNLLQENKEF